MIWTFVAMQTSSRMPSVSLYMCGYVYFRSLHQNRMVGDVRCMDLDMRGTCDSAAQCMLNVISLVGIHMLASWYGIFAMPLTHRREHARDV